MLTAETPTYLNLVGPTAGLGYNNLIGLQKSYPILKIRVQRCAGKLLLDAA